MKERLYKIWNEQVKSGHRSFAKGRPLSDNGAMNLACRELKVKKTKKVRDLYAQWQRDVLGYKDIVSN